MRALAPLPLMMPLMMSLMMTLACAAPAYAQSATQGTTPDQATTAPDSAAAEAAAPSPAKISFPGMGETILHISATERVQVPQDLLTASLRIEKDNPDAKAVQAEINTIMAKAVAAAKAVTTVKVSTGHYYVYQYNPNPQPPVPQKDEKGTPKPEERWRGSQSLQLQSTSADDLLKLAGTLQGSGLVMENLSYSLSPEKAEEAKDSLMEAALTKVKAKAERAAKAMNKSRTDLVEINIDSSDSFMPQPVMMRAMAMDAGGMEKASAPTASPGETEITLTVAAKAVLK